MSEHTLTTYDVRTNYAMTMLRVWMIDPYSAFDRWLAEHDREVAAKTLIDAAQDLYLPSGGPSTYVDIDYAELLASLYLKARAEQIEKGTGE